MNSLESVVALLRLEGRQDLSALLTDASVDFEAQDFGFFENTDAPIAFVNAAIIAPYSACKALRQLPEEDQGVIHDALAEVWAGSLAGGMYIQNVSFSIDEESLGDGLTQLFETPTGWQRVDRTVNKVRALLIAASTEEECQAIGDYCRNGLISLAQAVFDPVRHPLLPDDDTENSNTDVRRMLARYVASECPGASNYPIRKCLNGTVELANHVTHRTTATPRDASICAQATFNAIGLIAVISGKRDSGEEPPNHPGDPASCSVFC